MNTVIMMGRLTRDPESRATTTGNALVSFSIAVDRRIKRDGELEADFFNCTAFGKVAEFCEKYCKKGTKMIVIGHLQNDSYTNKDGQKVTATKIMVDSMEFAESKNASESKPDNVPNSDGFMNVPAGLEDELPFA